MEKTIAKMFLFDAVTTLGWSATLELLEDFADDRAQHAKHEVDRAALEQVASDLADARVNLEDSAFQEEEV